MRKRLKIPIFYMIKHGIFKSLSLRIYIYIDIRIKQLKLYKYNNYIWISVKNITLRYFIEKNYRIYSERDRSSCSRKSIGRIVTIQEPRINLANENDRRLLGAEKF